MSGENFYIDEPVVVSAGFFELGWFLQRAQAYWRHIAKNEYPDHKFLIFCNPHLHVFVNDFVYATIAGPKWLADLNLDYDSYEMVEHNSPSGSLTPPLVYSRLLNYYRKHYNRDKAIELWMPRGCNYFLDNCPQLFCKFGVETPTVSFDKDVIVLFPRARSRASNRNVPHYVWYELLTKLCKNFIVVLAGTPSGACLGDIEGENIINMIQYNEPDKTNKIIEYLNLAKCSISSQSGGTHISLLSGCPSYIIGHEGHRHCIVENRLQTPTAFRNVIDYRAIDSNTIYNDVLGFIKQLNEAQETKDKEADTDLVIKDSIDSMENIINEQQ